MSDPSQQPPSDPYRPQDPYLPQQSYGQQPYGQPGQQPYGQPGQQPYGAPQPMFPPDPAKPPNHPQATTAMILGIVALVGGCSLFLPLLVAPVAWIMGAKAVREIDASGGSLGGRGEANAGKITGIIGTVLLILAVLALIAFVVILIVTAASTSSDYDSYVIFRTLG